MAEIKSLEYYEIVAGGGTWSVDATLDTTQYMVTTAGTVTLTSNWSMNASTTPAYGTSFKIKYSGNVTPNGNTLTFFGHTMPDNMANKRVDIEAVHIGSGTYNVEFSPDIAQAGVIPNTALEVSTDIVLSGSLSTGSIPLSTTTAEQVATSMTVPGGTLSASGQGLNLELFFRGAANANLKTVRVRFVQGATNIAIYDTSVIGAMSTSLNNYEVISLIRMNYSSSTVLYGYQSSSFYDGTTYDNNSITSYTVSSIDFTQDFDVQVTVELASGTTSDLFMRSAILNIKK